MRTAALVAIRLLCREKTETGQLGLVSVCPPSVSFLLFCVWLTLFMLIHKTLELVVDHAGLVEGSEGLYSQHTEAEARRCIVNLIMLSNTLTDAFYASPGIISVLNAFKVLSSKINK